MQPIVRVENVHKSYGAPQAGQPVAAAVRHVSFDLAPGSFTALMGPSGSGKTTLLNMVGGLDQPDGGLITVDGHAVSQLDDRAASRLRLEHIGFVFQFFNLLPNLTARANVELPLRLLGRRSSEARSAVEAAVDRVGLLAKIDRLPHQLSGGEMQRIAIARAIAHKPRLILADEPTGNLDRANGESILALLRELVHRDGLTVLMASHDPRCREACDRVLDLVDGALVGDSAAVAGASA